MTAESILLHDGKTIKGCNEAALKLFGYSTVDDIVGSATSQLFTPKQPNGQSSADFLSEKIVESRESKSQAFECFIERRDGEALEATASLNLFFIGDEEYLQMTIYSREDAKESRRNLNEFASRMLANESLFKKNLVQAVQAFAKVVEARDPYTAGHEARVADLAVAIACEMNLSEFQVEGIEMGALIHDIGKIHLPAEILTKPSKLNDIEMSLIRTHPTVGFDILKDINFPWPVADIVLQHHERLDGSGYPKGLKADQIRLESKIVAVADVVEAISAFRPYRPAMGIDRALEQIKIDRGTLFDSRVVDACLTLFGENRFSF